VMEVAAGTGPLGEVVGMATNLFGDTILFCWLLAAEAAACACDAACAEAVTPPLAPALGSKRTCLVV